MRFVLAVLLVVYSGIAVAQTSDKSKTLEIEADTLLNRQDFQGALKIYNKIIASKKGEPSITMYKRAICYYSLEQFESALKDLNKFIPANPNFPQGRLLRAFVNRELGELDAQLEDIDFLLTQNPFSPDLIRWKAGVLMEQGEYKEAKNNLLKVAEIQSDEELELYIGLAYYYIQDADSAILHFDKAISINGGYVPAYTYAASLCVEQGAYDLALSYCDLGLRLEPENTDLLLYKGIALVEKDNLDAGCSCLAKAFYAGADGAEGYLKEYCYSEDD